MPSACATASIDFGVASVVGSSPSPHVEPRLRQPRAAPAQRVWLRRGHVK
jgi:hypothetical protein